MANYTNDTPEFKPGGDTAIRSWVFKRLVVWLFVIFTHTHTHIKTHWFPVLGMGTGTSSARYSTDGGMRGKYSGANCSVIISLGGGRKV